MFLLLALACYLQTSYCDPGYVYLMRKPTGGVYKYSKVLGSHMQQANIHYETESNPQADGLEMDESELEIHEGSDEGYGGHSSEDQVGDEVFVEVRFCTVCQIEQPLRTKHCRECGACVVLHDHHCPWLGNCIGEKNRRVFWWYLVYEATVLWLALGYAIEMLETLPWGWRYPVVGLCTALISVFCLMVSLLLSFHTYLACANKTTWEVASWHKIGYLSQWPSKARGPFSQGALRNLHFFCCRTLGKGYTEWKIPKEKPQGCYCC